MSSLWRMITLAAVVAVYCLSSFGQTAEQPVVLTIDVEDYVLYRGDVTDSSKQGWDPGVTTPLPAIAFQVSHGVGDIVAVSGKPSKGLLTYRVATLSSRVNPQPGQAIADVDGTGGAFCFWQILGPDGDWVGNLLDGGAFPESQHTITGGAGAFFGVTGGHRIQETIRAGRTASITEDPANRRINGGGKWRAVYYVYPKYRPSVNVTAAGPAVFHTDFSPVTVTNPARSGEVLVVVARNLGPVRPDLLPPGTRPLKADPVEVVNSPVEVTINGRESEVINAVGWPGTADLYRLDFRVPSGIAPGLVTLQLTAAWIPGPEVKIPVQ